MSTQITPEVAGKDGVESAHEARKSVEKVADDAPDPDSFKRLLTRIGALSKSPIYKDSRARLLIDGPETYKAMGDAMEQAQQFIYLETYIFADDNVGEMFAHKLKLKARAGVQVRVIYDSVGSTASSSGFFDEMEDAGVKVIEYHAISPIAGGNPLDINNRDHRKLLIVDNKVAFTGGINFSKTYSSSSPRRPAKSGIAEGWRDTHIVIQGPAVEGFAAMFREQWQLQGGSAESVPDGHSSPERAGTDLVVAMQSEGKSEDESPIYRAYMETIAMARERIWITQAYFAPDKNFLVQLIHAAQRGVDVRILVPGISDSNLVLYASRSHYQQLLLAGVHVYENTSSVLHAKAAVIDGIWSTVGSSNLDYRSFLHNDEVNAIVLGRDFAQQMEAQFERDIDASRRLTVETWNRRPLTERIYEFLASRVEYWL